MIIRPSSGVLTAWPSPGASSQMVRALRGGGERQDARRLGLGKELYIIRQPDRAHSDLDEIFARSVDPMNDYVSLMISHRNFREGSAEEVESLLFDQLRERPQNIPYCSASSPASPASFVLTWIGNPNKNPVKKSRIQVMPSGYYKRSATFAALRDH